MNKKSNRFPIFMANLKTMKILTGNDIRDIDRYTIEREPISSLLLIERAGNKIAEAIESIIEENRQIIFFVGKGNNGADGIVAAVKLFEKGYNIKIVTLFPYEETTPEYKFFINRIPAELERVPFEKEKTFCKEAVIVDAIVGTGINRELSGVAREAVDYINDSPLDVISIDMPSGLKCEWDRDPVAVKSQCTITVEFPKLSMLMPESGECCGDIVVVTDILLKEYFDQNNSIYEYVNKEDISKLLKRRQKFSHKGNYGHTLLIGGSEGHEGAIILAAMAATKSGCGLVSVQSNNIARMALLCNTPEVMTIPWEIGDIPDNIDDFSSIGIGCGMGKKPDAVTRLKNLLDRYNKPVVFDADALNIISDNKYLLNNVPKGSIFTPHPGELKRLIGEWDGDKDKLEKTTEISYKYGVYIIIKGAHTVICTPEGRYLINSSGNAILARGGSGDILCGVISGLLARGYSPLDAAIIGVYYHGKAADDSINVFGADSVNINDILTQLIIS